MASRDHFSIGLKCKACGTTGSADISEKDHPWARDLDTRVVGITEGFKVESLKPLIIRCKCGGLGNG